MSSGRHRLERRTPSRFRLALASPLGITATAVAAIVLLSIAVPVGIRLSGCARTDYLRISGTLSMAPVLRAAADEFNSEEHVYDGTCVLAQADETAPHRIMTELAGGAMNGASSVRPDVWVPESSAWVELTRVSETGAQNIETSPRSLAGSPVVLAAPEGAEGLPDPGEAGWDLVLPGGREPDRPLVMVDPNRGVDGMAAMHAVRRELGGGDEADADMTDFVRDVQLDTAFGEIDPAGVYPLGGAQERAALTVLPEQAVAAYNSRSPEEPLEALYPEEGTVLLDYPFVTTGDDPRMRAAADDLYSILQRDSYRERLRGLGFRDPDGTAAEALAELPGIDPEGPETHADLTGDALLASLDDWNRLSMPSRTVVLADVSAAMAEDLGGDGPSRLEVTRDAARLGLSLFPDETDMGLWLISDSFGGDGRQDAQDLGRLDEAVGEGGATRREELQGVAEEIEVAGGGSRLYDNILDAYEEVSSDYDEDKINSVIVLTAGEDGGSSDISHGELVAELQDRFDPERPVTMFIIAFGEQSAREELAEIAGATSGTLSVTDDPGEIGDIFLSSISRRLCVPDCGS
ncbi:substrate-binding domain-containing protein [Nocardiopsis potens]|uniref:substrate-binding domain-containing protein n=1 Tax=Nocardiopsis potens TaxID=1246458 RepID=UPI000349AB63|nr:substrate-binding domain-containing protein [Nocardiopsis potens]